MLRSAVVQESETAEPNLDVMSSDFGRRSEKEAQEICALNPAQASFPIDSWNQALRAGDSTTCVRLARDAGHLRQSDAAPALAALFAPTRGILSHWRKRSVEWTEVRTTAVEALSRIQDAPRTPERPSHSTEAVDALVEALFDPIEQVRVAAQHRLMWHGEEAAASLKHCLNTSKGWTLAGMRSVIDTLGALKNVESGPTVARVLLGALPHESVRWNLKPFRWAAATGVALGGVALTGMVSLWELSFPMSYVVCLLLASFSCSAFFGLVAFLFVFGPMSMMNQTWERGELFAAAARALTKMSDPRSLPCVIEAAFGANRRQGEARRTLLALLPLLDAQAYGLLPAESLHRLYFALGNAPLSQELTLAIVRSLEWVGTGQAVAPVQRLVKRGATAEIRSEAERILPCLLWRQQRETESTILLRAASRPSVGAEQLLRPAAAATDVAPEQLLRPSGGN